MFKFLVHSKKTPVHRCMPNVDHHHHHASSFSRFHWDIHCNGSILRLDSESESLRVPLSCWRPVISCPHPETTSSVACPPLPPPFFFFVPLAYSPRVPRTCLFCLFEVLPFASGRVPLLLELGFVLRLRLGCGELEWVGSADPRCRELECIRTGT
jgi:hypothetical protein